MTCFVPTLGLGQHHRDQISTKRSKVVAHIGIESDGQDSEHSDEVHERQSKQQPSTEHRDPERADCTEKLHHVVPYQHRVSQEASCLLYSVLCIFYEITNDACLDLERNIFPYRLIGVYIILVTWMAKNLRQILYCSDTLRFDDMPQVDRLLRLLDDIYMVREHKDWLLEEELYSKLGFLWRSPETLIQYSKPKQD